MEKLKLICSFIFILFISCTFDYEEYLDNLEASRRSPSIQIINIHYHNIVDNKEQTTLISKNFNYFSNEKIYKIEDGNFFYRSVENDIGGVFDKLDGSEITKNLDMKDNVKIRIDHEDKYYLLTTNRLFWKNDVKELEAPASELVFIQFDDNEIKGKHFSYFFKTNTYYFYSGVEGFVK